MKALAYVCCLGKEESLIRAGYGCFPQRQKKRVLVIQLLDEWRQ